MDVLKRLSCFWNDFHSAHLENHEKEVRLIIMWLSFIYSLFSKRNESSCFVYLDDWEIKLLDSLEPRLRLRGKSL